jgi:general secretion pathway protein F
MMASFAYQAYLDDGSLETGVLQAADLRDASRKLAQAHKRPFALDELAGERAAAVAVRPWWELRRSTDLTKLLSELSVLLDAGFNVAGALRIIASAEASTHHRTRLLAISDQIADGKSLSEAFASLSGIAPNVSAILASGESSGKIAEVVAKLSEAYRYRAERRAAINEALAYPAFLVVMVIAAFLFLSLFLMPAIEPVFDSGTVEKPIVVSLLSGFGKLITEQWPVVLGFVLAAGASVFMMLRRPGGRVIF